jgi:glycosyltransferase involved in cell wall biosynthesis
MKILMISSTLPYPPTQGGTQVRTFNLLKYLHRHHDVTLVTQYTNHEQLQELEALRAWVKQLVYFPQPSENSLTSGVRGKLQRLGNFVKTGVPPSVASSYCLKTQTWIDQQVRSGQFDALTCEHSVNEIYVRPDFQQHVPKRIVNIHSSVYGSCQDQLRTGTAEKPLRDILNLPLLYRYERRFCQKFSDLVVTTPEDLAQLQRLSQHPQIRIIPNGVDLDQFPSRSTDPGGRQLIFIGAMDNLANIDAATYLCDAILPAIRQRYPDTTLKLVGARPTAQVLALAKAPGVDVTGRVASIAAALHQATLCIIPMRTGYGIKNKTLEAMAAGVPVVASDRGLEGLTVDTPLRALRANRLADYVDAISRLFEDALLRHTLSENARRMIETEYTWEIAGQQYEQVLSS